ncbi:MAG: hypothetical protein VX453_08455 [Acidobacteriota bacterium]|nr:hypothetical protein [Acidobacteriota bacterium]
MKLFFPVSLAVITLLFCASSGWAGQTWDPPRLANGDPDINGMWNNVGSSHVPLELPAELAGKKLTEEERLALFTARSDRAKAVEWQGHEASRGVGAYANYWFDWFWKEPVAGEAPALVIHPQNGQVPAMTVKAQESVQYYRDNLHNIASNMESGDRCLSRGVFGMMMPTAYNNGKLFVQTENHIIIHSEMIHNARIIAIDSSPHVHSNITQWEGNPRGRWEGNTLVVESTNFKAVGNMRAPGSRAPQHEGRRMVERFTFADANTLNYELTVDDPETYSEPWAVAFPYKRDNEYQQFEYACHEGNWAVPNSLSGARAEEATE